jgi:hypothetical protein
MEKANDEKHKRLIIETVILSISVAATLVLTVILAFLDKETTVGVHFAILLGNLTALFAVLWFSIKMHFDEQSEKNKKLATKMEQLEGEISISETYKKIYALDVEEQRELYLRKAADFVADMEKWIQEWRSGPLSRDFYYGELERAGSAIIDDYMKSHKK